ncbi:MAG: 50S ribosomal protein L25/general stress protein Ctc [Acidobacteriota bacterium]
MQEDFTLQSQQRPALGTNASRRLRVQGQIPAVIYGRGIDSVALTVEAKELSRILHSQAGQNTIFKLKVGRESHNVLIKDFQIDPIQGHLLHADFQTVAMDEVMTFHVPLEMQGTAEGVKAGGVLDTVLREVEVQCLPTQVPDRIAVDVSDLVLGGTVRVEDLKLETSAVTLLSEPDLVVVTILPPKLAPEEAEVVEEEAAEPEVITGAKAEEEQPSE